MSAPAGWVRIADIGEAGLTAGQVAALLTVAITELGIAEALVMMHGQARGTQLYVAHGGHVRFDDADEPCLPLSLAGPS